MQARVEDIDHLKQFRLSLQKFQEAANVALSDAESDLVRTMMWIETEQFTYWHFQVRKRADKLSQAEERLRAKKIFRDSTGSKPSTVDEEKAVRLCKMRLEEANQKVQLVTKWKRQMEKVSHDYKGNVQRFATNVQALLPSAIARMEVMIRQLEQYIGYRPVEVASSTGETAPTIESSAIENESSMKRGIIDETPAATEQSGEASKPDTAEEAPR